MTEIQKENKSVRKVPNKGNSNIPRLRFPEFTEEWNREKIGSILTIGSGKDYKHLSKGNIPVFGTGGFMTSVNEYLYDGESVCIGRKGTINKPSFINGKFWTVDTLFFTHSFQKTLPKFVYYVFKKVNWLKYNEASGVPSLSKATIEQIEINISSIEEQKKIATFLSLLDSRIDTQNKIIEQLETLIKGLSEKLFSQKIRFKDFMIEWELKSLGEIGEIITGKTPSTKDLDLWNGDIQFVTPTDITENKYQHSTERTIKKTGNLKILPQKSIMFTCIASI